MSRVTPEQIKAIQELKSRKAKEREEKAAAEKETADFIAKEFGTGDPAPALITDVVEPLTTEVVPPAFAAFGKPCNPDSGWNSVTLESIDTDTTTTDAGVSDIKVTQVVHPETPAPDTEARIVSNEDIQAALLKAPDTDTLFREWLRTPEGLDASDPRLPNDAVRRGVFLEDALSKAFAAGYNSRNI